MNYTPVTHAHYYVSEASLTCSLLALLCSIRKYEQGPNSGSLDYFAIGMITFILPIEIMTGINSRLIEPLRTNAFVRTFGILVCRTLLSRINKSITS